MAASAVSFVMMAASECFLPSIVVAVKFFNFVKFAVFYHAYQLFQAFCTFYPKAGSIGWCIGGKQGGLLVVPSNPIAVCVCTNTASGWMVSFSVLTSILAAISV